MSFTLEAACLCNTGRVRRNNEDNFYFDGQCLDEQNNGLDHPLCLRGTTGKDVFTAVFDGMGGENFGESASWAAAKCMQDATQKRKDLFISKRKYLYDLCLKINLAVVEKQRELLTNRMGSTLVSLYFSRNSVYMGNLGDSRAYRLRNREFLQLSEDHIEKRADRPTRKAPLTQHLGIDPVDYLIEPCIVKGRLQHGDQYLLCSDGLTDMLSDDEIAEILHRALSVDECVQTLVDAALEKGGRDNVTVILCRLL